MQVVEVSALDANAADAISVTSITPHIGAEVSGVDLSQPLSDAVIGLISDALVAHKVLFFRDQIMTSEQQLAFGRRFGPLEIHPFLVERDNADRRHPELIVVETSPERPDVADTWHSDVTWRATPALGSILRVTHCPDSGGDTRWANMAAAYEGLDDATRSLLSGLVAVHDWHRFREMAPRIGLSAERIAQLQRDFPPAEHPVVRTHPVSGAKVIYVNSSFTVRIKGMADSESGALLNRLYALADVPDYRVEMRWRPGSVAFWDNRSTQHSVTNDIKGFRRMERVTVAGSKPF